MSQTFNANFGRANKDYHIYDDTPPQNNVKDDAVRWSLPDFNNKPRDQIKPRNTEVVTNSKKIKHKVSKPNYVQELLSSARKD